MSNVKKESVITAVGLSKIFRDFWARPKARAVNDIDFEVKQGEVFGLLGPNGSGKSTTVKMILGLLYPTGGNLKVLGQPPRAVETKKLVGYLPEETYLYKYLTAQETLEFFGSLFGLYGIELKNRVDQLLDMVGLSHARNRCVGEFSKGMQRRIGLAQAMINDPSLLILDEPTSGLDPLGCREVKDLIKLLKDRGKTVVVTSHLLSDIEDVCDRVVILYGGEVRAEGELNDLLQVEEDCQITLPKLNAKQTEKVLKSLRENLDTDEIRVSHPKMNLEDFFLDVINKAKQEDVQTAGAVSSGEIASYLQSEEDIKENELLKSLTADDVEAKSVAISELEENDDKLTAEINEQDLSSAIEELAEEKVEAHIKSESEEVVVEEDEALQEANKVLGDLLTGKFEDK
ncbi:ABC transporter ATP-binding protein [Lentisphaerota bacterium WC36G]|nr:ABC transporter ATP-binding protein [Lentisphaerae bacterium WC36]